MNKRKATLASAGILGLLLPALLSQPALAGPPSQSIPETVSNDVFILDDSAPGVEHVGDSTFYPLPDGYEDAMVVTAEVAEDLGVDSVGAISESEAKALTKSIASSSEIAASTPEQDAAEVAEMKSSLATPNAAAASAWTDFYTPPGGSYGSWYQRNTVLIPQGDIRKVYSWQMNPGSNSQVCGQGIGWYRGYNGSDFGTWSSAYNLGCGASGSADVVWDNAAAYPKFRAKASYTLTGGFGKFI